MKQLVKEVEWGDYKEYRYKAPKTSDYDTLVNPPVEVRSPEGDLLLWSVPLKDLDTEDYDVKRLWKAVEGIKYASGARTLGMLSTSRVIGFQPRITVRQDFARVASSSRDHPVEHAEVCSWAAWCSKQLKKIHPEQYQALHNQVYGEVKPCWIIKNSVYTSGIINKNNPLRYHKDNGNFEHSWASMITLPVDLVGGEIVFPELKLALAYKEPSITLFHNPKIIHGVKRIQHGTRYTIVYYPIRDMRLAGTPAEELARIRKVKTEREYKRVTKAQETEDD